MNYKSYLEKNRSINGNGMTFFGKKINYYVLYVIFKIIKKEIGNISEEYYIKIDPNNKRDMKIEKRISDIRHWHWKAKKIFLSLNPIKVVKRLKNIYLHKINKIVFGDIDLEKFRDRVIKNSKYYIKNELKKYASKHKEVRESYIKTAEKKLKYIYNNSNNYNPLFYNNGEQYIADAEESLKIAKNNKYEIPDSIILGYMRKNDPHKYKHIMKAYDLLENKYDILYKSLNILKKYKLKNYKNLLQYK